MVQEGLPTYDEGILDVIYESFFTDTYLGTRATDINVEGGGFIDTYSSHAPEELVPGSVIWYISIFKVLLVPAVTGVTMDMDLENKSISGTFTATGVTNLVFT